MLAARLQTAELGGPVHYADFGGSGPAIVCVHGLGGHHANWMSSAPLLARSGRVLAPDLAGFGLTPLGGRSPSVDANRALVGRFLAEIAGAPAILMGNSMGGLIAMMQAAAEPAAVAGLVLVDPALPRASALQIDRAVAMTFAAYATPGLGERFLARRRARLGPEGVVRETLAICNVDPSRIAPEVIEAHLEIARRRAAMPWADAALLGAARSLLRVLARRRHFYRMLQGITAPTLLVHGARDRLVPLASAREAARARPDWTFEVFEDLGHTPMLEDPASFAGAVERWLAGPGRAAVLAAAKA